MPLGTPEEEGAAELTVRVLDRLVGVSTVAEGALPSVLEPETDDLAPAGGPFGDSDWDTYVRLRQAVLRAGLLGQPKDGRSGAQGKELGREDLSWAAAVPWPSLRVAMVAVCCHVIPW